MSGPHCKSFCQQFVHVDFFKSPNVDNLGLLATPLLQFLSTGLLNDPLSENHTFQFNLPMTMPDPKHPYYKNVYVVLIKHNVFNVKPLGEWKHLVRLSKPYFIHHLQKNIEEISVKEFRNDFLEIT